MSNKSSQKMIQKRSNLKCVTASVATLAMLAKTEEHFNEEDLDIVLAKRFNGAKDKELNTKIVRMNIDSINSITNKEV